MALNINSWQNLTDMFTSDDQLVEMNKKYRNTILEITTKEYTTYGKYQGSTQTDQTYHKFYTKTDREILLSLHTDLQVTIPNPKRGLYNTKSGMVFFTRLPYRQHKRGLYEETAQIIEVNSKLANEMSYNQFNTHIFDVLDKSQQLHRSFLTATKQIVDFGSIAMNREFGIAYSPTHPVGFILLFEDLPIGTITNNMIRVHNSAFIQEVLEGKDDWAPLHEVILEAYGNY